MSYISSAHLFNVLKAAELLSKGIDISKLSYEEFKQVLGNKEGKIVKRVTPLVEDFVIHIDDIDVCPYYCKNSNIKRTGRTYSFCTDSDTVNLTLNSDTFKQIVRTLYKLYDITGGLDKIYYDEECEKEYNNFNRFRGAPENFTELLSKDKVRENFKILTSVIYQRIPSLKIELLRAFEKKYDHFNIKGLEDKPVIDNRLFINLRVDERLEKEEYLVISKNLYDYYWASQGSRIQSCYSLTSEHHGLFGMIPFGIADGHYIVYTTKDNPNEYSIIPGTKWKVPFMGMRCWAWTSEDGQLVLDKKYGYCNYACDKYLTETFPTRNCILDSDLSSEMVRIFETYKARWYPDSIKNLELVYEDRDIIFSLSLGKREFIGCIRPVARGTMATMFENIDTVDSNINYEEDVGEVNGVLCNAFVCPYTGLLTPKSLGESPYARFFKKHPVKNLVVMSYMDGYFRGVCSSMQIGCDNGSVVFDEDRYSSELSDSTLWLGKRSAFKVNLQKLKSFLEIHKKFFYFDALLLKCVEGDRVSYIKYLRG